MRRHCQDTGASTTSCECKEVEKDLREEAVILYLLDLRLSELQSLHTPVPRMYHWFESMLESLKITILVKSKKSSTTGLASLFLFL